MTSERLLSRVIYVLIAAVLLFIVGRSVMQHRAEHRATTVAMSAGLPWETPLCAAAQAGDLELMGRLLSQGADPNAPGRMNETPLEVAVARGARCAGTVRL